jgi:hypothetical protein
MKPNPLQSSEYRATPEYEYLYTASTTARSVPPVARYDYARDNTYLLRPALLSKAGASAGPGECKRTAQHRAGSRQEG